MQIVFLSVGSNHGSWIITTGFQKPPSRTSGMWNQHAFSRGWKYKKGAACQQDTEQSAPKTSLQMDFGYFMPELDLWLMSGMHYNFSRSQSLPVWSQTFQPGVA